MEKKIFYITFGQKSPFRLGWCECLASSREAAQTEANYVFGLHWSNVYEEQPEADLFPAGKLGEQMEGH